MLRLNAAVSMAFSQRFLSCAAFAFLPYNTGGYLSKVPIVFEPTQFPLAFSSKTGMSISRQSSSEGTFAARGL